MIHPVPADAVFFLEVKVDILLQMKTLLFQPFVVSVYLMLNDISVRFTHHDDMVLQRMNLRERRTVRHLVRHALFHNIQELNHTARLIVVHLLQDTYGLYDIRYVIQVLV